MTEETTSVVVTLNSDDKDAIAKLRWAWFSRDGAHMARNLAEMLRAICDEHPKLYLRLLVKGEFENLASAVSALESNLSIKKVVQRETVIETFLRFQKAYLDACEVLYLMHRDDAITCFREPLLTPFNRFRRCNTPFRDEIKRLVAYPGLEMLLAVSAGPASPATRFIGEAAWEGEQPPALDDSTA